MGFFQLNLPLLSPDCSTASLPYLDDSPTVAQVLKGLSLGAPF